MKLDEFLTTYPPIIFGNEDDEIFASFRLLLNGMSSFRLAKLLSHACKFLDHDSYVEIGTYTGFTLLSAGYEKNAEFIGIDNFSENYAISEGVQTRLKENMNRFNGPYKIVESDFRDVKLSQGKIGVFFIDGKHTYQDVIESLHWVSGNLSDEALIVFDDVNVPGVRKAINEIKADPQYEEFFYANSFNNIKGNNGISSDKYIHNGISLMAYRKTK